ncbi:MAG: InlB B-repeat-containing protein [Lactimicrobium massiliense]|nr:InlB B-repeat-containing protein [Lactimicrobium massiliense]MDD6674406.1 InlB B-repeat-containing protein [Lactimicrobium massiliense]
MRSYSRKNKKGFTLGEMLITVGIVAILSAVAIISVTSYLWNMRLMDADQAAKEIFLAAQYHLSVARERGTLDQYSGNDLGTVDTLYKDSDYVIANGGTVYDLVYSPGKDAAKVIDAILPQGSIDETMRTGGSYIITYDKDSATVLGVFYSYAGRSYGYSFTSETLTNETAALQAAMAADNGTDAKAVRKHFPDKQNKQTIGFYGGKDLPADKTDAPILRVENGDTLSAIVTLSDKQNDLFTKNDYAIQLTIKGEQSGNTVTKEFTSKEADAGGLIGHSDGNVVIQNTAVSTYVKATSGNGLYQYAVVLDAWQNKKGTDRLQIDWQFADASKPLIPGENITVTASIVKKNDDGSYSSVSKPSNSVLTNSMFGSLKKVTGSDKEYVVTISSIRHLENLAKIDSSELKIVKAQQVTDISFTAYQKNMASFFNSETPELYIYQPVNLNNDLSYDAGYLDSNNISHQYMLSDLQVNLKESDYPNISTGGGVFGSLASGKSLNVSNLQIVDINVKASGNENAGALLGSAKDKTTVNTDNVLVWDKSATIGISAEADAGGLIGQSDGNVIIKNTAVSAYVKATSGNAGGLIGSASSLSVSSSYVSAHTYQKDYVTEVDPQTDKDSQHYNIIAEKGNAGGIVGSVSSLKKLTDSYVTASIYGKTANAFAGTVSDNTNYTNNNCYAVTVVNGTNVKEPSTFSGKADTETKYVNDESLLDGNEAVAYPYTVVSSLDTNAKAWFLKSHVGDWNGASQNNATVSFNNDEILQLIASVPNVRPDDEVEVQFFYPYRNGQSTQLFGTDVDPADRVMSFTFKKDGTIETTNAYNNKSANDWRSDLCKKEKVGNVTKYTINIDDITYMKDSHSGRLQNVLLNSAAQPGYDVTARVLVNGIVVSESATTNSSFGDNTDSKTAVISCGRHLQNMSSDVAGRWSPIFQNASLTADIHWNTDNNTFFERVKKLRANSSDEVTSVYLSDSREIKDQKFYPITGHMMFTGSDTSFFGHGHTISDISFDTANGNAGLFETTQGLLNVSDLTIENGVIQASGVTNAGILAGFVNNKNQTTISHCFVTGDKSMVRIGNSGNAGGLIGDFQGKEINNSGASAYVQGANAGGLVGQFNSGTISASFSGGRTTNGSYIEDELRTGYYNVEGYSTAGGLVGNIEESAKITNCYSSSSVFGGAKSADQKNQWSYTTGNVKVGGLIGSTTMSAPDSIHGCYVVGMVQGPKDSTGALVSTYGGYQNDMMQNNYYLEGINFEPGSLEELPAASGLDSSRKYDDQFMAVDYYSSNNPIAKTDPSITYITYSYDSGLKGEYPFISYTRQAAGSNISVHLGGWQIPVDKRQYRLVRLYDDDQTTLIATKAVLAGSNWQPSDYVDTSTLTSSKSSDAGNFVGWVDANGNVLSAADFASITSDITAYAKYAKQITFKYVDPATGKDGGLVANQEFNSDGSVTVPVAPSFSGYAFNGWYTAADGGTKVTVTNNQIPASSISGNVYYAHYHKIVNYTYTMIFCYEKNDGTPGDAVSSLNKIIYERSGDNYNSFAQAVSMSNRTVANATIDKLVVVNADTNETVKTENLNQNSTVTMTGSAFNKTYYVMYKATPVTYIVHHVFHDSVNKGASISNGALVGKDSSGNDLLVYSQGNLETLDETKTGYAGNMTNAAALDLSDVLGEFEITSTIEQQNLNDVNSNVEITIEYYRKSYTLSYSAPNASNYISPQMIPYGAPVTLAGADQVVRPGYTLKYWTVSYDGKAPYAATAFKIASMPATDVTAYETLDSWTANKTAKVTVQFWQQKPHTKKTPYTEADYDYYGAYTVNANIGDTYSVASDAALAALKRLKKKSSSDFDHFTYTSEFGNSSVAVSADGSSTINLYYNRNEITINFYKCTDIGWLWSDWKAELVDTWKGLYGEEFSNTSYTWDNSYDWYEKYDQRNGPTWTRLTFITYFHVEDDAKDSNNANVMNLYGKASSRGNYTVSHYVEKLNGTGAYDPTGYDVQNSSTVSGESTFTLSNKYPNGYELAGYRYYSTNRRGQTTWYDFQSASEGTRVSVDRNLAVFYKRKDITVTLSNAVINNKQSGVDYQFTEKYGTSYKTIASDLDQLTVSKPVNAQGEEFAGWYLDEGYTKPFTGDDETLDGPLQLFAKWETCKYHVNFYGSENDTAALGTVDVSSGDVLYNVSASVDRFPEIAADEGYEVRWYYRDSDGVEHQYVKDRQIQLDLVSKKEKDSAGNYTINLYARKVAVNPVHLYYELYDRDTAEVIEYNGQTLFTTNDTYSVGSAYTISAPELDGYTFVSGNTGVATSDTQENPICLIYKAKQGSWRHIVESYARYADIDENKTPVSVELSSRTVNKSDETGSVVDTASTMDGYTFVQSALLSDENDTSYAVSDASQVTVSKPADKDQSQVVRFWYTPSFDGTLQNSSAVYDGKEHSVSYQMNSVPAVGSKNTLVYKYTYSLNNASTATTYVQYAWTNADGTAGTYGNAPVNAGVYSVQVEILLYKDASVNTANLTSGSDLLTVYRNREAGSLTISPASLVITSGSQSWVYGSDGTGFHTNTDWTASVNGTAVDTSTLPVTVTFLDTSKIQQPGTMANEFTVSFTDSAAANNYAVTKVYGSLDVVWQYKVKYMLSLPDVVYEAKSDAEKAEAVKDGTDVKPVQVEMYETTVTSSNPNVFDAAKASDSAPVSLDGLKLTNGDTVQNVGYHNGDQTVTYVYTPDFGTASIVKDGDLGVYEMKLASDSDELKKVLSALKPYLSDQTPGSSDDTPASDASDYQKYLGTKNSDYRLVYEMTYTQQNSDGTADTSSTVVYLAGEDGTVKDKDGRAAVLSGSVPASGTYVVSGRIVLQHRTDIVDEKGNKTGDKWSDANIVYASSDAQNVTVTLK